MVTYYQGMLWNETENDMEWKENFCMEYGRCSEWNGRFEKWNGRSSSIQLHVQHYENLRQSHKVLPN